MPALFFRNLARVCVLAMTAAVVSISVGAIDSAKAMDMAAKGDLIVLAGNIRPGDSLIFADFLKKAPKGTFRSVYLTSGGGFIAEAIEIGRIIRHEGMATIVDASKSICASACTAIFASGVKRLYLNASAVADGKPTKLHGGLGFHDGSNNSSLESNHYSGEASAMMIDAYYEFGVPGAAKVISMSPPDSIYILSGKSAISLGIATDLGKS